MGLEEETLQTLKIPQMMAKLTDLEMYNMSCGKTLYKESARGAASGLSR